CGAVLRRGNDDAIALGRGLVIRRDGLRRRDLGVPVHGSPFATCEGRARAEDRDAAVRSAPSAAGRECPPTARLRAPACVTLPRPIRRSRPAPSAPVPRGRPDGGRAPPRLLARLPARWAGPASTST